MERPAGDVLKPAGIGSRRRCRNATTSSTEMGRPARSSRDKCRFAAAMARSRSATVTQTLAPEMLLPPMVA